MSRLVLAELKRRYVDEARPLPREVEAALRADDRAGARAILEAVARRRRARRAEGQRLRHLCRYEQPLWDAGVRLVAGVDEAGMAPAAGPVCAAAVILPPGCRLPGVDDSKRLDPETRDALEPVIKRTATAWAVAFADAEEVDRINVYHAGLLAMRRAVEALGPAPEHLLVDARRLETFDVPQDAIVGGDRKSLSIAAASILAKTARDRLMVAMDRLYPGYGFARHKGYPVPAHRAALAALGPCEIHRRSFITVRAVDGEVHDVEAPEAARSEEARSEAAGPGEG